MYFEICPTFFCPVEKAVKRLTQYKAKKHPYISHFIRRNYLFLQHNGQLKRKSPNRNKQTCIFEKMGDIRHCKWCGRSYDTDKSTSHYPYAYCSLRCEMQVEKAIKKSETKSGRTFWKIIAVLFLISFIVYIFNDSSKKSTETQGIVTVNTRNNAVQNPTSGNRNEKTKELKVNNLNKDTRQSSTDEKLKKLQKTQYANTYTDESEEHVGVTINTATEASLNKSFKTYNDDQPELTVTNKHDVETKETIADSRVYDVVEQMPTFPGGEVALLEYICANLKYPQSALEQGTQGTIMLRFVVTGTGDIGEVQILKGLDPDCDDEAKRVVKSLPKFNPGMQQGRPVSVWYTAPVRFVIE